MEMESKKEWIFVDDFISCIEFMIFKNLVKENFVIGSGIRFENKMIAKKIISLFEDKLKFNCKNQN